MKKTILSLENVSLSIGGKQLFSPLSFELKEGERVGIVGASGTGKSQLLKAIIGLSKAEVSGKIFYSGNNICTFCPEQLQKIRGKEIGLIAQNPFSQFNPTRRVGSQIIEAALSSSQETSILLEKAAFFLNQLGISHPKRLFVSYPQELSGGMLQRALITMFLLLGPKILLTDEPTTALDPLSIASLLEVLIEQNAAYLFVTHNSKVASQFCHRILSLKNGAWHAT